MSKEALKDTPEIELSNQQKKLAESMGVTDQEYVDMTKPDPAKVTIEPESVEKPIVADDVKSQLPEPKGWKILVAMPQADEKTKGGIVKASSTIRDEEISNICGYVLKMGNECYQDESRFPTGPWCKSGDWVIFRAYSGTRIKMYGQEFRLINDDTVEAVVDDPTGVVRA